MEVTFYEDPACSWCWAFQPVSTAFAFEFGDAVKPRWVMGGLRDWPAADVGFIIQQWKKAKTVSGMPFECGVWKKHVLRTTFIACRAVKAASMIDESCAHRLLRRLREAQFAEQIPIDDVETIIALGAEVGIDQVELRENIASGRAETLFARDRAEASQYGFGFPTIVLRNVRQETPLILQGSVPYSDLLQALSSLGVGQKQRRRFRDTSEHWTALFGIHRRLTLPEIQKVTQIEKSRILGRLEEVGARRQGSFYELPGPKAHESSKPAAAPVQPLSRPSEPPAGSGKPAASPADLAPPRQPARAADERASRGAGECPLEDSRNRVSQRPPSA